MVSGASARGLTAVLLIALLVAIALGACTQPDEVRFPHVVHLAKLKCGTPGEPDCLTCSSCHTPSEQGRVAKLPEQTLCRSCHEREPTKMARVLRAVPHRPYGEIHFDHDSHLSMSRINGQCVPCHAGVVEEGKATIPPMSQCFTCHEHQAQWDRGVCSPCHEESDLRETLPVTFLQHSPTFLRQHRTQAMAQEQLCQSCHSQSDCQSCHDLTQALTAEQRMPEKTQTQQVHRGDFMVRHAIEARSQPAQCMSCHQPASCDSCHLEHGVSGNGINPTNPHPPGWIGNNVMSKDFHGRHARRDLLSCAGCHEAGPATNCIRCHKVGAYGGNPHPSGWRSARSPDEAMCRYCHEGM